MVNRIKPLLSMVMIMFGLGFMAPVNAQDNIDEIRNDIEIMETILDQLLQASREHLFDGGDIKGFYFEEYGLLFTVDMDNRFHFLRGSLSSVQYHKARDALKEIEEKWEAKSKEEKDKEVKSEKDESLVVEFSDKRSPNSFYVKYGMDEEEFDQWVEKLDEKVQTFLSTYVDVRNFLSSNELISVVIFFNGHGSDLPVARIYQIRKRDIDAYRNEKISTQSFNARISKDLVTKDDHTEEIEIMGSIMQTALKNNSDAIVRFRSRIHGIYLKDLGVMFSFGDYFFKDRIEELSVFLPGDKNFEDRKTGVKTMLEMLNKRKTEQKEKYRKNLSQFQEEIIRIVGNYGATLRFLPNDQSVFVVFSTGRLLADEGVSNVMLRFRKADILSYSQHQLNFDEFSKRVQVVQY